MKRPISSIHWSTDRDRDTCIHASCRRRHPHQRHWLGVHRMGSRSCMSCQRPTAYICLRRAQLLHASLAHQSKNSSYSFACGPTAACRSLLLGALALAFDDDAGIRLSIWSRSIYTQLYIGKFLSCRGWSHCSYRTAGAAQRSSVSSSVGQVTASLIK
jgi:hypothetical protein